MKRKINMDYVTEEETLLIIANLKHAIEAEKKRGLIDAYTIKNIQRKTLLINKLNLKLQNYNGTD